MEKVSFDIVLNLKNNISGALANVRKMFDGVDKSAKSVCSDSLWLTLVLLPVFLVMTLKH